MPRGIYSRKKKTNKSKSTQVDNVLTIKDRLRTTLTEYKQQYQQLIDKIDSLLSEL